MSQSPDEILDEVAAYLLSMKGKCESVEGDVHRGLVEGMPTHDRSGMTWKTWLHDGNISLKMKLKFGEYNP